MKKSEYIKPSTEAVSVNIENPVLAGSTIGYSSNGISTTDDFGRSKGYDDEDDWDE